MKSIVVLFFFLVTLANSEAHANSSGNPWSTVSSDDYNRYTEQLIKICRGEKGLKSFLIIPIRLALSLSKFRQFYDCYGKGIGLINKTETAEKIKISDVSTILRHDAACFGLGQCVIHQDGIQELEKLKIK
ncbi:hypothetical protein WA026_002694 [Henosepilachna vigintioctopunctata]|uniref:Uncharacterized protein n=1 Tax=Henosepilachna vigintioctopunctata TaxID=420089 RepID=A0AAW1U132_9CUCU